MLFRIAIATLGLLSLGAIPPETAQTALPSGVGIQIEAQPKIGTIGDLIRIDLHITMPSGYRAVIPKPGHRSDKRIEYERQRWFRRGRAWRVGGEARISRLKHCFGMHRSRYRGEDGMGRTVIWAAIANNLAAVATRIR